MAKGFVLFTFLLAITVSHGMTDFLGQDVGKPLRFHAVGDQGLFPVIGTKSTGEILFEQSDVEKENSFDVPNAIIAQKMNEVAEAAPIDFVMGLGDNFYFSPDGIKHIDDPRVAYMFSHTYNQPNLKVPFNMILGNHDCYGDPTLQVQETQEQDLWEMPSNYYEKLYDLDNGKKALILYLDGCILSCLDSAVGDKTCDTFSYTITEDIVQGHMSWMETLLEKYSSDETIVWRTLAVHWPFFSAGMGHNDTEALKTHVMPFVAKYGIDVVLSGHDHSSQYLNMSIDTYNQKGVSPGGQAKDGCTLKPIGLIDSKDLHYNQGDHVHQFLAGNSGAPINPICTGRETQDETLVYGAWVFGFMEVEITSQAYTVRTWAIYEDDFLTQVTIHAADSPSDITEGEAMDFRSA